MPPFEGVIRPFQLPDYTPRVTEQAEIAAEDPITVTIGQTGRAYAFNGSHNATQSAYMDATSREKTGGNDDRQTTTTRVYNPVDESQYVDVEAIDVVRSDGNNGQHYQLTQYEYENQYETGDY